MREFPSRSCENSASIAIEQLARTGASPLGSSFPLFTLIQLPALDGSCDPTSRLRARKDTRSRSETLLRRLFFVSRARAIPIRARSMRGLRKSAVSKPSPLLTTLWLSCYQGPRRLDPNPSLLLGGPPRSSRPAGSQVLYPVLGTPGRSDVPDPMRPRAFPIQCLSSHPSSAYLKRTPG